MKRRRWPLVALVLILLMAAGTRFYHLNTLPPGLWFDEGWVSLKARELAVQGDWPVYFAANFGGMHPFVVYLTAAARRLTGNHPLAIRYAVATAGVVATALTFFAVRAIGRLEMEDRRATQLGVLSAFILAITFPFLVFTRMGLESMLPAIPATLTFWALAVALRQSRWRMFALAGLFLGAALYSFDSARFLPVAVTVALFWVAWQERAWQRLGQGWAITAVSALIIFLPLGRYFWQNRDQFLERASVASYNTLGAGAGSVPLALLRNAGHTLAGFSLPGFGDQLARHNLPGRPIYDVFLSLLFWLGVILLLRRWRRRHAALLLSWAGVMILPVILTDGAPTYTRLLGVMPALSAIAAVGGLVLVRLLARHTRRPAIPWLLLTLGLTFSLGATIYDYFGRWANDPRLYEAFAVDDWLAATEAKARLAQGPVYLAPDLLGESHPTFDLLLRGSGVKPIAGPGCLPYFAGSERPFTYLIDERHSSDLLDRLRQTLPQAEVERLVWQPHDRATHFLRVTVKPGMAATTQWGQPVARLGPLALLAYEISPQQPQPGGPVRVRLVWRAQETPTADHTVFLHLYAPGGENEPPLTQQDGQPCGGHYPTSRWQAGEVVVAEQTITVPRDFAGETAVLALGAYTWPSLERLPLTGTAATLPGERLPLATLAIGP